MLLLRGCTDGRAPAWGNTNFRIAQNLNPVASSMPITDPVTKSATSECRSNTCRDTYSGSRFTPMPIPLTRKNSAASWCRSRPPRVWNDHSRLST